jgi:SAM-dependent methyltransferase
MIDRNDLLNLIICPACQERLESFHACTKCGIRFAETDGTPALFPKNASRTVAFQFTQDRSTVTDAFRSSFHYPARCCAGGGDIPYHLDLGHLNIIDQLPKGSTILEIGCGGGQMRAYLQAKGYRYVGTDISKSRVSDTLKQHGGPDILCDAHFLPFANQSFDLVYSAAVTEHLACPYLVAQEVHRALRPSGFYLGNVSFLEPWHDDSFFHMSPLGVFENLTQARFEVSNIWPGQGYSGFRAILHMGNKATKPLTFVGDALYLIYRSGNRLRNLARRRKNWSLDRIEDAACVSGAIDWIARRPKESGRV